MPDSRGRCGRVFAAILLGLIVSLLADGTSLSTAHGSTAPRMRAWWKTPSFHVSQEQEFFLRVMSEHYGPAWLSWMPDAAIWDHWRRFPAQFGHGPEALFLAWMNANYGPGWQHWVPSPVVRSHWYRLFSE
ncbi:MAG: hypothetical protein KF724_13710 [Phycisphaeraceae bacterium]|nr:hypothetical protein [Phycisphaeraceae bacterium]